jgi:hypothetical protein
LPNKISTMRDEATGKYDELQAAVLRHPGAGRLQLGWRYGGR